MKSFTYTIKDEIGIHARPAGMLSKLAKSFESEILLSKDGRSVDMRKLMMLMGLGVKFGDTVTVTVNGSDEAAASEAIKSFLEQNL